MGYDDLKVIEAHRLVQSIATGQPVGATIHDALKAAEIVDAMAESASTQLDHAENSKGRPSGR